jgi:nucleotide-binding universal stress UspA family protein
MRAAYRREWHDEMRAAAEAALAEVGEFAESVTVDSSSAARGLHDLAEREQADLIVLISGKTEALGQREGVGLLVIGSRGYGPTRARCLAQHPSRSCATPSTH